MLGLCNYAVAINQGSYWLKPMAHPKQADKLLQQNKESLRYGMGLLCSAN